MENTVHVGRSTAQTNPATFFQSQSQLSSGVSEFPRTNTPSLIPRLDVLDTGVNIIYVFEIPGVDPDSLVLEVSEQELALRGKMVNPAPLGFNYLHQERAAGDYIRLVTPPNNVDVENIAAEYKNGLLSVQFARKS